MRKFVLLSALLSVTAAAFAQEDSLAQRDLDEAVVYSNKFAEKKKNIAQKIDLITSKTIAKFNAQNTGDLLISTGNVFVQKSQQGGSSPVLRGFEASRVLMVVDGIRLNNAIYRAGHLHNIITVDQNMLERVEVMYGPSSTLYGSDALGGIIHMRTKSPVLATDKKLLVKATAFARYSTVNEEKTGHVNVSIAGKKMGWLQSFTYSYFGDMKMGGNYTDKYPNFGRRSRYISTAGGADVVLANNDDRIQRFSGYEQWDITQKFLFRQNDKINHLLNFQFSNSTNVPRYDRLQDIRNFGGSIGATLRFAEWFYGPQKRIMGAYEFNAEDVGFLSNLRINVNYQDVKESRQTREYRRYDRFDSRREHIKVIGFTIDGRKIWGNNELNIGIDGQLNDLTSVADRTNLTTGAVAKLDTRYPDGDNNMNYFGVYGQHLVKLKGGKLVLNDGLRIQTVSLHSTIADNSFFNFPFTDIKQSPFAVTGNFGVIYMPANELRFTANISSGFRAPNIDDVARIFESATSTNRLVVPNPDVNPEYTYNLDLGLTQSLKNFRFEFTAFYTIFRNAMALAPFQLNGQDSVIFNTVKCAVFANQNVNKAYALGFNTRLRIDFSKNVSLDNTVSYTYGRFKNPNGTETPLDHVPPVFGKSSFTMLIQKLSSEIYLMYNGWKKIKDYNPNGEDNGQYATAQGMPSWATLNWRISHPVTKYLTLQGGIENIFDRNYRYFASGFSAPGRNFIVALRAVL